MNTKPLTAEEVDLVRRTLGPVQCMVLGLGHVDVSFGQARLGPSEKCIWLEDGRRVTISLVEGGGYIASVSTEPDPEASRG